MCIRDSECVIGRLIESAVNYDSPEDNMELLNSLSPELIANVSEVVSGTVNYDDLGANEIVINQYRTDRSELNYDDLKIGDTLIFRFEVGEQTIEKTFTVAGIAYFPSTGLFYCCLLYTSDYWNTENLKLTCPEMHSVMILMEQQEFSLTIH